MIALVGAGRMGGALLEGWIAAGTAPSDISVVDPKPGSSALMVIDQGARHGPDTLAHAETVLLAVKPQVFAEVWDDMAERVTPGTLIISIMAGVTCATLSRAFPGCPVIRAMPNTPASVGAGVTGLYAGEDASEADVAEAERRLGVTGAVVRVYEERDIDRVTSVSGSGPAYVFHLAEALAEAGEAVGLSADVAAQLACETIIGAAELLKSDGDAAALRRAVTSPNGTTQAALEVLMPELPNLMRRTVQAAFDRAEELGKG